MKQTEVFFTCDWRGRLPKDRCAATSPRGANAAIARSAARQAGWKLISGMRGYDRPAETTSLCPEHQ